MPLLYFALFISNFRLSYSYVTKFHTPSRIVAINVKTTAGSEELIQLSPMVENMAVSKTIAMHALTKQMESDGIVVYSLCVGEPDYEPPPEVILATVSDNSCIILNRSSIVLYVKGCRSFRWIDKVYRSKWGSKSSRCHFKGSL